MGLGDQGKLKEAASMEKEVLEKRTRILGEEHPDTISAMNNLDVTFGDQGKLGEAASMKKEALENMTAGTLVENSFPKGEGMKTFRQMGKETLCGGESSVG